MDLIYRRQQTTQSTFYYVWNVEVPVIFGAYHIYIRRKVIRQKPDHLMHKTAAMNAGLISYVPTSPSTHIGASTKDIV